MYVVTVTFEIHSANIDAFMPLMREQAANSLRLEDGCHQFDIAYEQSNPGVIFLYELYQDRVAFEIHLESAHYHRFASSIDGMVAKKTVTTFDTLEAGG